MTIKRKIEKFIEAGGEVSADKSKKKWAAICLQISRERLKELDQVLTERDGLSRNAWIREAIQEKLQKLRRE